MYDAPPELRERIAQLSARIRLPDSVEPPTVAVPRSEAASLPPTLPAAQPAPAPPTAPPRARDAGGALDKTLARTGLAGVDLAAQERASLPFARAALSAHAEAPPMALLNYASLCAELAVAPEKAAEVLARYHVPDEASRRALDAHWKARLAAQPDARAMFDAAVTTYQEWLLGQPR